MNGIFALYDGGKSVEELKADLHTDLQERFCELKSQGKDDETAFNMTISSIGDIEETVQEVANLSRALERQLVTNFSASDLSKGDFAGVDFKYSDLHGMCFDGQTFIGVKFGKTALNDVSFKGSTLKNVAFPVSYLSKKYYTAIKTVCADLSKVTIL